MIVQTIYNTLIPVLEKHKKAFGEVLEEVTADTLYSNRRSFWRY